MKHYFNIFLRHFFAAFLALNAFLLFGEFFGDGRISRLLPLAAIAVFTLLIGLAAAVLGREDRERGYAAGASRRLTFLSVLLFAIFCALVVWLILKDWPKIRTEGTLLSIVLFILFFNYCLAKPRA